MPFDPDKYLALTETEDNGGFDPDLYIESTQPTKSENKPKTLAGKVVGVMRDFSPFPTSKKELTTAMSGRDQDMATMPLRPFLSVEKYAGQIKDAGLQPFDEAIDAGIKNIPEALPLSMRIAGTGAAELFGKNALRFITPFTPTELGAQAQMIMPTIPNQIKEGRISPNLGKNYIENAIPSTPSKIRHSQRYLTKDAADFVMERPQLGTNRNDIRRNAEIGINDLEKKIQKKLENSIKVGKVESKISRDDISQAFDDVISDVSKSGTEKDSVKALKELKNDFIESHPESGDSMYWNNVKRSIHRLIGDKGYISQNPSAKVKALKSVANRIKTNIESKNPGIKELNAEQAALLEIRDSIIQSSPKDVRDISWTGPLKERAAIVGGRILTKKRSVPQVRVPYGSYPSYSSPNNNDGE